MITQSLRASLVSLRESSLKMKRSEARREVSNYIHWYNSERLYDRLSDPAEMVHLATDENYKDVISRLDTLWEARVQGVQQHPKGLTFIAPQPGDNGVSSKEYLELEKSGQLP